MDQWRRYFQLELMLLSCRRRFSKSIFRCPYCFLWIFFKDNSHVTADSQNMGCLHTPLVIYRNESSGILTAVALKIVSFDTMKSYSLVDRSQRFGGTCLSSCLSGVSIHLLSYLLYLFHLFLLHTLFTPFRIVYLLQTDNLVDAVFLKTLFYRNLTAPFGVTNFFTVLSHCCSTVKA
jgi:hypothetical protein